MLTRALMGTDCSPEYNEHFCYKLDSRVKHLTMEWNQNQEHFITHASRSLLWIRFVPPPLWDLWPILPIHGSAPWQIWLKHLNVSKFRKRSDSALWQKNHTPTEQSKKQRDNIKNRHLKLWLHNDCSLT